MMLGSVVGSAIGGIFQTKISYRNLMLLSVISFGIGMYLLGTMDPQTSRALLTIYMIITGFGVDFRFLYFLQFLFIIWNRDSVAQLLQQIHSFVH